MKKKLLFCLLLCSSLVNSQTRFHYINNEMGISLHENEFSISTSLEGLTENSIEHLEWYKGRVEYNGDSIICTAPSYSKTLYFRKVDDFRLILLNSREEINVRAYSFEYRQSYYISEFMDSIDNTFYLWFSREPEIREPFRFVWEDGKIIRIFDRNIPGFVSNVDSVLNVLFPE